jgi:hypothetical protein
MKQMKRILSIIIAQVFILQFAFAQQEEYFVPTASKEKRWNFVKTVLDKNKFGKVELKKIEKKFGVPTSIEIDSVGNFFWIITTTNGSKYQNGVITEKDDDVFFEFAEGQKLKAKASFREYDTEMCLTVYGLEKDEYVELIFKKE